MKSAGGETFAGRLIAWHQLHGRHDLPWQQTRDPYRVWLSEIMLQQTQVATVIPYYERFLVRFPDVASLAAAPVEDVMALWSGLGYYARARNLHKCAQAVMRDYAGRFPQTPESLVTLPGIGRSTANAIAVFCFGARGPILDGNVKRLLCRFLGIEGYPGTPVVESRLWQDGAALLPESEVDTYIQAQMDMGASICTRSKPRCESCPIAMLCSAFREGRTAELPAPRPRKSLPERQASLLAIRCDDRILLETRPPAGIWGGLLSLPELPEGEDAGDYCLLRFGLHVESVIRMPAVQHGFSHFRLRIEPLACKVVAAPVHLSEPGWRWIDKASVAQAALPAPVRKILNAIP